MVVDSDGTGSLSVVVGPGSVGTEGLPCEWRHDCAISVESDEAEYADLDEIIASLDPRRARTHLSCHPPMRATRLSL